MSTRLPFLSKYLHVLIFILMFDFLIRGFETRNSNLLTFDSWLSERHNCPHLFIVYPHPFKLISRRINPSRLLRPPLFYCIYLVVQPPSPAYHSPYNSAHENIYLKKNTAELS